MLPRRPALVGAVAVGVLAALSAGYFGVQALLPEPEPAVARPVRAATAPTTPAPTGPGRLVIHGTGDVNLDPTRFGLRGGAPWTGVSELFGSDDLTVVNLECAPGEGGEPQDKQFTFRCPDGFADMAAAGVDVANLGNNHSLDFGRVALLDGLERLRGAGVAAVGAGRNTREANAPAILEREGWTIAVLGFSGVVPEPGWFAGANHPGLASGYSIEAMTQAVRAADEMADLVFVTIHWGLERAAAPRPQDIARAKALIDAGADGIFGHHAHRIQPLEWYEGRPIAYGLGNFVWPQPGPTAVARLVVEPDGSMKACLLSGRISGGRPSITGTEC